MSTLSQFGFGGGIKSIQRGIIQFPTSTSSSPRTQTATITTVNTSKSILYYLGVENGWSIQTEGSTIMGISSIEAMIQLTNSTTITATMGKNAGNFTSSPLSGPGATTTPPTVSWQVVEYY